ncbi:MAG: WG repeat-containing protein [Cyclobacteriaceae bacterium]|nr:WG repeat-containing protein [Cyclobacteriaceae bacterium]
MKYFLITVLLFFSLSVFAEAYTVFEQDGKYGIKNQQGVVLIPPLYEELGWSEKSFSVVNKVTGYRINDRWGLISLTNQLITPAEYYTLLPGSATLIIASKLSLSTFRISTGCIDSSGKVIIPFKYSGMKFHSMRAITFTLDDYKMKYGMIDFDNKLILPQLYQNIYPIGSLRYAVQNFENKTALFSENGGQITGFVIDSISQVYKGFAIIYQDGKQGLIDREGEIIKEPVYREISLDENGYHLREPDTWHILDVSNKLIQKIEADSIVPVGENRLKIVTSSETLLTDTDFRSVGAEKKMNQIQSFQNGMAVFRKNKKEGVLNTSGSILLPPTFDKIQLDGRFILAYSFNGNKKICDLYNSSGQKITKKYYDQIHPYNGSYFPVSKNHFFGGLDKNGVEIIACTYDSLLETNDDLTVVKFMGQYGVITTTEQWKVLPQPNRIVLINADRYFEIADSTTYFKSIEGTTLYFTTNKIFVQDNNLIEHTSNGGKWIITMSGQIIYREETSKESIEKIFPSTEGLRGIKKNGKYGFIDDLGRLRIANRYEDIMPFQETLAAIKILGKWGFINKEDNIVIQPSYEEVSPFINGRSVVRQNGKYGIITNQGKVILEVKYDTIQLLKNNHVLISLESRFGLADLLGNILLQLKYDSIEDLNNGFAIVKLHEKFGVVNLSGVSTIPNHYDHLIHFPEKNIFLGLKKKEFTELVVK